MNITANIYFILECTIYDLVNLYNISGIMCLKIELYAFSTKWTFVLFLQLFITSKTHFITLRRITYLNFNRIFKRIIANITNMIVVIFDLLHLIYIYIFLNGIIIFIDGINEAGKYRHYQPEELTKV